MRTPTAFIFGALAATLIAAAAFRGGGQPVDSTFTYQGQLRNAGQLLNGNVDVRFTLWDSDVGGTQIGNANSFTNYPLTDGRFALGLNFGNGAFNGDQRWVQVEFRSPAGVGQYLTLNPRDKIMATPYALYALNGTASQWDYNPKTQSLTAATNVSKVGIGTTTPTAALEVVSATGGDDAVKLPLNSVGIQEIVPLALSSSMAWSGYSTLDNSGGVMIPVSEPFELRADGHLALTAFFSGGQGSSGSGSLHYFDVAIDGVVVASTSANFGFRPVSVSMPLSAGPHTFEIRSQQLGTGGSDGWYCWATAIAVVTPYRLQDK